MLPPRARRSDEVDLCEINYLGSSLIDLRISTGKRSWLSLRRAPLFKSRFKAGTSRGKNKAAFIIHYRTVCQLMICKALSSRSGDGQTTAVFDFFCQTASLRLQDRSGWKMYTYAAVK